MFKYPRTQHLQGSRLQDGDFDLEAVPWEELKGKNLVIEEKMDGANAGVSFEDGKLMLQSRGHFLRGGPRERHFDRMKQWAAARETELYLGLGDRYVMFGEWMYAKHTCFYDNLPHYFMEFDLFDKEDKTFLSTRERKLFYQASGLSDIIEPVLVLATGEFANLTTLKSHIVHSHFKTPTWKKSLSLAAQKAGVSGEDAAAHTCSSDDMEGIYVKWEEGRYVKGRYKFVRSSFTNSIMDQEQHWLERPIIANQLAPGAEQRMFG